MTRFRRWLGLGCWAAAALGLLMFFWPEQTFRSRALVVGSLAWLALGLPVLARPRPKLRIGILLVELAVVTFFVALPNRPEGRTASLSERYVRDLQRYCGLSYVWGGETEFGVDCSGLVRRAIIRACWSEGLRRLDGELLRTAIGLWLHDCSADALGAGYRDLTRRVAENGSLNAMKHAALAPGDLAVVTGGLHIMVYLGEQRWIEADPEAMKVVVERTPSPAVWFNTPAKVVRWAMLEE